MIGEYSFLLSWQNTRIKLFNLVFMLQWQAAKKICISMDIKKRFKGFHYEVGQLPEGFTHSKYYWNLPYGFRRLLHHTLAPQSVRRLHYMRRYCSENVNHPSLKPFCDTRSIFVHIPKAAGISVGFSLYGRKTGDHRTLLDYKLCFGRKEYESFFKFTFVRNPWDRLLSAYMYLKQGGRNEMDYKWSVEHLSAYDDFDTFVKEWVSEDNIHSGLHFRPQNEFVCSRQGAVEVDFVGYYERINEDYDIIRNKIGRGEELAVKNKTSRKRDFRQYYSDKACEIVEKVYDEDIQLFGYTFDGFKNGKR